MDFDVFPDRFSEQCRKWNKEKIKGQFGEVPDDIVPMWIADMDFKAPDILLERLHKAVDIGVFGYTYVYEEFYDAVLSYYKKHHQTEIDRDWLTLCYGTVGTLHFVVQAFCEPGDTVILQTPVYDPFHRAITAHGAICIENPLVIENNRYQIDFSLFEKQLKEHKPKLFLLCTPHNPSGRIWSREELTRMITLCKQYGTIVVADEVHGGMIYAGGYSSVCELGESFDNVILLSSPNKKYNIGGLKTSYAIVKNEEIRKKLKERLEKNSVTSPNVFGIIALSVCMKEGDAWSKACMQYVKKNYDYAAAFIKEKLPKLSYMEMESSYLLWVDIRQTGISSDAFTHALAHDYGVLVESGRHFVNNGEGFIRINLGTQFETVKKCFDRIKQYYDTL